MQVSTPSGNIGNLIGVIKKDHSEVRQCLWKIEEAINMKNIPLVCKLIGDLRVFLKGRTNNEESGLVNPS
jgi:hypothetical protein